MPTKIDIDALPIAQMLYVDMISRYSIGDLVSISYFKEQAKCYIEELDACCSPANVLSLMEHQNFVVRDKKEYRLLEHP